MSPPAFCPVVWTAPNEKVPWFSRKNSRFSGKKRLKRVRLTCCWSASTCAKSVLTVRSAVRFCVTPYFRSMPASAVRSSRSAGVAPFRAPVAVAIAYGLISRFLDPAGTVRPTTCAAREAMWIPLCPCDCGVGDRNDSSFFHRFVRIALKPQTWDSPGR